MTLRLGFVGVGRWARKLAESFRACGAEIVAYDRQGGERCYGYGSPICDNGIWHRSDMGDVACVHACDRGYKPLDGFGKRMPWRDQLADKSIDAIVAVAPPEVTTEVALACAAAGKPVMATKPLFDHPERITAPFYVDFFRLWSEAHKAAKQHSGSINYVFEGCGPVRSFPGSLDYGPHVMAAMLDLWRFDTPKRQHAQVLRLGETENVQASWAIHSKERGATFNAHFGNGAPLGTRRMDLLSSGAPTHIYETPTHIGNEPKDAIMQKFCRAFMADVSEGFVSTDLLNYSREGMRLLRQIREGAK